MLISAPLSTRHLIMSTLPRLPASCRGVDWYIERNECNIIVILIIPQCNTLTKILGPCYSTHTVGMCFTTKFYFFSACVSLPSFFLSRHRSAETQCWMSRYVRGTWYVRTYVAFHNAPAQVQQPDLHSYLNRVSNVFIACK